MRNNGFSQILKTAFIIKKITFFIKCIFFTKMRHEKRKKEKREIL